MNRKKKISNIYNKKLKKAKSHLNPKVHKEKYISKAEREKLAAQEQTSETNPTEDVIPS